MINNGEAFDMSFGGEDVHVPAGKFGCSIEALAHHIVATATKWGFNVEILDSSDLNAKPAAAITAEPAIIEEKTKGTGKIPEPLPKKEEVKEEIPKKGKPSKK